MISVIIEDNDKFFHYGMETLLEDVFTSLPNEKLVFGNTLNSHAITSADIIIKRFSPGEFYICNQDYWYRNRNGLTIGICDEDKKPRNKRLPHCFENIVFIDRSESICEARRLILRGWHCRTHHPDTYNSCLSCKHHTLSPQQMNIAEHFHLGKNTQQIARHLNINMKTVAAHKRLLMIKFDLSSDYELLNFLKNLKPTTIC